MNEELQIIMSQLADGELTSDQANELLLNVLDDAPGREKLKEMLRLRQASADWRRRQPYRPVMVVADRPRAFARSHTAWHLAGLTVAACVGGLLVLTGIWTAGWLGNTSSPGHGASATGAPAAVVQVTSEQMQQVAKVFALHESVAGPLAWYASDDRNVRLASTRDEGAANAPIAVLLKIGASSAGTEARTYVIVCREKEAATFDLPGDSAGAPGLRAYLVPRRANGKVDVQYVIALDGARPDHAVQSSVTGERRIGLAESSLGQLAMGDGMVNVEASAWTLPTEEKK